MGVPPRYLLATRNRDWPGPWAGDAVTGGSAQEPTEQPPRKSLRGRRRFHGKSANCDVPGSRRFCYSSPATSPSGRTTAKRRPCPVQQRQLPHFIGSDGSAMDAFRIETGAKIDSPNGRESPDTIIEIWIKHLSS
ncbi:hypothetical protein MAPG_10622 [Magnaporthiopsis poae ATCC 64411]|uniref:Uncharacterized protein n=1 Tax=Magnaporthiopsis poae (strain ATCC 64411 / 73-15) TaxID=644358 RepID=A0A0C4ED29_MAGP6|nr:hypothetical protein MAPG_10622 [Magnaporthiopsis poae ATCC 64411]